MSAFGLKSILYTALCFAVTRAIVGAAAFQPADRGHDHRLQHTLGVTEIYRRSCLGSEMVRRMQDQMVVAGRVRRSCKGEEPLLYQYTS